MVILLKKVSRIKLPKCKTVKVYKQLNKTILKNVIQLNNLINEKFKIKFVFI